MRLYLLPGGLLDVDRAAIHPGDDSRRRLTLPVMSLLVESDGRRVLIDTGCPPEAAGDDDALYHAFGMTTNWIRPRVAREHRIDRQLAALGLEPQDLDLAINTHLHFDHAGGNPLLPVTIAVQRAELEAAQSDEYLPVWDAPDLRFRAVDGDWSPLPGVEMLFTPGHTAGHQSVLLNLDPQPWLFTGDAVYTEEHWIEDRLGPVADIPAARASLRRLRQIAAERHAKVIFGHDVAQWEALGMAGALSPRPMESR